MTYDPKQPTTDNTKTDPNFNQSQAQRDAAAKAAADKAAADRKARGQ